MSDTSRRALNRVRRLALIVLAAACGREPEPEPAVLHLGPDTVVLAPGARITDVHVRAAAGQPEFLPDRITATPGDVLRFSSEDGGPHALVFDASATDPAGMAFVGATDQARSLPLTEQGAAWIVALADAPAGHYTVRCLTHDATLDVTVGQTGH